MKKVWFPNIDFVLKLCLFLAGALLVLFLPWKQTFASTPIRVIDGDTFEISGQRYRLYGIDCPESDQPFGRQAREAAVFYFDISQSPDIEVLGEDRYGRKLAIVSFGEDTLQEYLLQDGLAWLYTHGCRDFRCLGWGYRQIQARGSEQGLWADPSPVPPWKWRRLQENN